MTEFDRGWYGGVVVTAIIAIIIIIIFHNNTEPKSAIIEAGCAQYNSQTGDFEWVEKK